MYKVLEPEAFISMKRESWTIGFATHLFGRFLSTCGLFEFWCRIVLTSVSSRLSVGFEQGSPLLDFESKDFCLHLNNPYISSVKNITIILLRINVQKINACQNGPLTKITPY